MNSKGKIETLVKEINEFKGLLSQNIDINKKLKLLNKDK